jgi:hypothetical protein
MLTYILRFHLFRKKKRQVLTSYWQLVKINNPRKLFLSVLKRTGNINKMTFFQTYTDFLVTYLKGTEK